MLVAKEKLYTAILIVDGKEECLKIVAVTKAKAVAEATKYCHYLVWYGHATKCSVLEVKLSVGGTRCTKNSAKK